MPSSAKRVRVSCLGTGDAFSSGGRLQSGFHVTDGQHCVLIDCGCSVLSGLHRAGLSAADIDLVVISHLHGDHFGGIPFLLLDGKYAAKRTKPLVLVGPPGLGEAVDTLAEVLYPGTLREELGFTVEVQELEADRPLHQPGLRLTCGKVRHGRSDNCFGLRLEIGSKIIAYTGDTEWTEALLPLSQGADLLIAECCAFDAPFPAHLDYRTLLRQQQRLGCRRLVLTHLGPQMLTRLDELELEALIDGMEIVL